MKADVERMIENLSPEIDKKCAELRAARKERLKARLFTLLCITVLLIPPVLVFAGVSLTLLILPPVFMSVSIILLLPVLLSGKPADEGGHLYEQA